VAPALKFSRRHPIKGVLISEMAMQLPSSSVSSAVPTGVSVGGNNSVNEMERLQQQLKNLQKSTVDLHNQGLPVGRVKEQMALLSQQIQIVQSQITRLQVQKTLAQEETQLEIRHNAPSVNNTSAAAAARTTDKVTGATSVADARQHTQKKAHAAQTAHPASAEAIAPAEPPLVSVKA